MTCVCHESEGPCMIERNTFLKMAPPAELTLQRAATEPAPWSIHAQYNQMASSSCATTCEKRQHGDGCDVHILLDSLYAMTEQTFEQSDGLPASSPLLLESFETEDFSQTTRNADLSLLAPSALSLEYITTDAPFQTIPTAFLMAEPKVTDAGRLTTPQGLPPDLLSFEYWATDDPFQPTPKAVTLVREPTVPHLKAPEHMGLDSMSTGSDLLSARSSISPVSSTADGKCTFSNRQALEELILQRAATEPMPSRTEEPCEGLIDTDSEMLGSFAGLPVPPPLDLESMQTADPFERSSWPVAAVSQPLYVALPTMSVPPPLEFESIETADPFEYTSTGGLLTMPAQLPYVAALAMPWKCICPPPATPAPLIESLPPTRPPSMVAPLMDVPGVPLAPRAPPSRTPGTSLATLEKGELHKPGVLVRSGAGCTHVHWAVDARKLDRQDKQVVSGVFTVMLPEHGPTPFKILLYANAGKVDGKKGAGFLKVKGCGRVVLKCEAQLPESCSDIAFRIGLGRDEVLQPFRGPVVQNFHEHSCHGLTMEDDEWDFRAGVDENSIFLVTLEIALKSNLLATSNVWWSALDIAE